MRPALLALAMLLAACSEDDSTVEVPDEVTTSVEVPTSPPTTSPCPGLRSELQDAKRERIGSDSPEKRAAVDATAARARAAGCDISDLVGPNVGAATTAPPTTKAAAPAATSPPSTEAAAAYYANCDAVRAAGAAPLRRGEPGYRAGLDRDGDGIACDTEG